MHSLEMVCVDPPLQLRSSHVRAILGSNKQWASVEPERNKFTFNWADKVAALAEKNGQMMRCHALVWYKDLPEWRNEPLSTLIR